MNILINKSKLWLTVLSLLTASAFALSGLQSVIVAVSAEIAPIVVQQDHLDFGPVFPAEGKKTVNFTVSLADGYDGAAYYRITQTVKPKPGIQLPDGYVGSVWDYCSGHPEDEARCYKNLCPYLTKHSDEGEGDLEAQASVGNSDAADNWKIDFAGNAMFVGGDPSDQSIITEPGVYGCDIHVAILSQVECSDRDGDTYFSEGGNCGAADCNDNNSAINPAAAEICDDQLDNDCDGQIDSADPACPTPPSYQCADGSDNDGDGKADLADPGCSSATDNDESSEAPAIQPGDLIVTEIMQNPKTASDSNPQPA